MSIRYEFKNYEKKDYIDEFWNSMNSYIGTEALKKVQWMDETTKKTLRLLINKGLENGKSYNEIAKDVRETAQIQKVWRAKRIARTETHSAAMHSLDTAAKTTRLIQEKEWISARDSRTRRDIFNHFGTFPYGANGERIQLNAMYQGTGESLKYPGDSRGSAGNVVNCFASSRTLIFTDKGWKQIRKIEIGDKVLTHKNRFRKVKRLFKGDYEGDLIKIYVHEKVDKHSVLVTPDHPFLNNNGVWIKAKDIKIGDQLKFMASFCSECGKSIPWYKNFCDHSCLSKFITNKQWNDSEHRKNMSNKTSQQLKREYKNGTRDKIKIIKKARQVCKDKYGEGGYLDVVRNDQDFKINIKKGIESKYGSYLNMLKKFAFPALGKVNYSGSKIEKAMEIFLNKKNKEYIKQFSIGRRRIDFYVENEKMFIEVDGFPFHEDKEKERKRDLEILTKYPDHKIAHVTYKKNPPKWEYFTLETLNHTGTFNQVDIKIKKIEHLKMSKMPNGGYKQIYNFAVEEDESYIARGFVVHNCRCIELYHTRINDDA